MNLQAWIVKKMLRKVMPKEIDIRLRRNKIDELSKKASIPKNINFQQIQLGGVKAEWAFLEGSPKDKAIVYLHGGGYCLGSITSYRYFTSRLAKETGIRTLCVEYSLAPENPFPAALEDVISVYRSLLSKGIISKNIVLIGDSAGGGLCLAVTIALRDNKEDLPAAMALFSPLTDITLSAKSYITNAKKDPLVSLDDQKILVEAYASGQDTKNPLISPRFGNFEGFPPILIHTGTDEVLIEDSLNVVETARRDKVEVTFKLWKDMFHVFTIFPTYTPEGKKSLKEVAAYIKQYL